MYCFVCKTLSHYDLMDWSEEAIRWVAYLLGSRLTNAPESIRKLKSLHFTCMFHLTVPFTEST